MPETEKEFCEFVLSQRRGQGTLSQVQESSDISKDEFSASDVAFEYILHVMTLFESKARPDLALDIAYAGLRYDESAASNKVWV